MFSPLRPRSLSIAAAAILLASTLAACGTESAVPTGAITQGTAEQPAEFVSVDGALDIELVASESLVPGPDGMRWAMTYNSNATGPTWRIRPGDTVNVTLVNQLSKPTSLHTHGLHVDPEVDSPFKLVQPGEKAVYRYEIPQNHESGTFWYHPHAHKLTAAQAAAGLSGAIVVERESDDQLVAATVSNVAVITDPEIALENPNPSGEPSGMQAMHGRYGQRLLINGQTRMQLPDAGQQRQRVHVVNALASLPIRVQYTGTQMVQVASAGGRLRQPRVVQQIDLAPGERAEVALLPSAQESQLLVQRTNGVDAAEKARPLVVVPASTQTTLQPLPTQLVQAPDRDLFADDVQVADRKVITMEGHMVSTLDGKSFDPKRVDNTSKLGTVEEWVIQNNSGMGHPFHLHAWPFQVQGSTDWEDVVWVPGGSELVMRVAFEDFGGKTVYHCHILDHEDTGMMGVLQVL